MSDKFWTPQGSRIPKPVLTGIGVAVSGLLVLSCSVPAGAGPEEPLCVWDKPCFPSVPTLRVAHPEKLCRVRKGSLPSSDHVSAPRRGGSVYRYYIGRVKPKHGLYPIGNVTVTGHPVRMPVVKPYKPPQGPCKGHGGVVAHT